MKMAILKDLKLESNIITLSSMEKNSYDQLIDLDIKWYEGIRKLTTEEGEDYTTG